MRETQSLALGLTGPSPESRLSVAADTPFFELKGAVEALLSLFADEAPVWTLCEDARGFEPSRSATVALAGRILGIAGQYAAPATRKLRQPVWLAELDLEWLLSQPLRRPMASEISRYQSVERGFSYILPDHVTWAQVESALRGLDLPALRSLQPVEVWRDSRKHPGMYALLLRTTFQSRAGTLTEDQITGAWSRIIETLTGLGGTLRDH